MAVLNVKAIAVSQNKGRNRGQLYWGYDVRNIKNLRFCEVKMSWSPQAAMESSMSHCLWTVSQLNMAAGHFWSFLCDLYDSW